MSIQHLSDATDRQPSKDLIKLLEDMLEDAKSGELRSIVCACVWASGSATTSWRLDGRTNRKTVLGALAMTQYELMTDLSFNDSQSALCHNLYGDGLST